MPGKKTLTYTGHLGEVMRESVQTAFSWVRSNHKLLGIDPKTFDEFDVHVHVPSAATPKDGPSAGITMATAIASMFTERPVVPRLSMTGEIYRAAGDGSGLVLQAFAAIFDILGHQVLVDVLRGYVQVLGLQEAEEEGQVALVGFDGVRRKALFVRQVIV
mgnify:CR=1 FL=1